MITEDKEKKSKSIHIERPSKFSEFIGQKSIKTILKTAIKSSKLNNHTLGHILLSWPSGYGKTTLAQIIAGYCNTQFYYTTGYAITKPSDIISLLQKLENNDILFIDEIHRIKAHIEEILYIAMEDNRVDIIMPDWTNLNLPIEKFTLVWATTKPESLSSPLKNRFIYSFNLEEYNNEEKEQITNTYLKQLEIITDRTIVKDITHYSDWAPRNIKNLCIKIRDYIISNTTNRTLTDPIRKECKSWIDIENHWITKLHKKYLALFENKDKKNTQISLKSLAGKLWISEKTIENEIEPLLMRLWWIEKTNRWRTMTK